MLLLKVHNLESLYTVLDKEDEEIMKKRIPELICVYSNIFKEAQQFCKTIMDSIISLSNNFLGHISSKSLAASRIHSCILRSAPIDKEDLKLIGSIPIPKDCLENFECSEIIKSLEFEFQQQLDRLFNTSLQDDYIFYQEKNNPNAICFIDTKTLKLKKKTIPLKNKDYIGSLVLHKKNKYYLATSTYTGFNTNNQKTKTLFIKSIDLTSGTIESVLNAGNLNGGPLILYNNSLYMFSCSQDTIKYDLEKRSLSKLGIMPENLNYISASNYLDSIIVTGFKSRRIYQFNPISTLYSKFIKFDDEKYKYLFDNWIVCVNDGLYEMQGSATVRQQSIYNVSNFLKIYSCFRQGYLIYFIDSNDSIHRINTIKKNIELVKLT